MNIFSSSGFDDKLKRGFIFGKETYKMKNIVLKKFNSLFLLFVLLTPTSCGNHRESKHKPADTKTTYWIYDKLSNSEIKKMKKIQYSTTNFTYDFYVYLDPLYKALKDENNNYVLPEKYACYSVECSDITNYKNVIRKVWIYDPSVTIFGLSTLSSEEDVTRALTAQGFTLECSYCSGNAPHWTNEYTIIYMPPYSLFGTSIGISAKNEYLVNL